MILQLYCTCKTKQKHFFINYTMYLQELLLLFLVLLSINIMAGE